MLDGSLITETRKFDFMQINGILDRNYVGQKRSRQFLCGKNTYSPYVSNVLSYMRKMTYVSEYQFVKYL